MTVKWETVRIFISSTFEDMHAERDYLVKQVFPELREWCEQRKLHLVDIDLRWGVREEDTQNKNVVDVCLKRIDEARPFFLCFLGQRRGWVPQKDDISLSTLSENAFPDLKSKIGKASVTELEIIHALINPFHAHRIKKNLPYEYYDQVKYAFFYLRDNSYLNQISTDFPDLRNIYTNEGLKTAEEQKRADLELERWVKIEIPNLCRDHNRPLIHYSARWDPKLSSPELLLPLTCSSTSPITLQQWRERWKKAGIDIEEDEISIDGSELTTKTGFSLFHQHSRVKDPDRIQKAQSYNRQRSGGRLTNFEVNGEALSRIIIAELKTAITERYPNHYEIGEANNLQKELDQQEQYLATCSEGFIARGDDFKELNNYVNGDSRQLYVLTALGGMGKSTLLANWIEKYMEKSDGCSNKTIHFRFIGQSDQSTTVYSLLYSLLSELKDVTKKISIDIPDDPQKLIQDLPKLLEAVGTHGLTIFVLDALNQLESGLSDLSWLPYQLPANIKIIVSFKRGEPAAEELLKQLRGNAILAEIKPFTDLDDRRKLVQVYLSQYLKDLDQGYIETLIQSKGAENPLFLKVVLSELRVFGAFANLGEKIRSDFGETPVSAFQGMLKRLEHDPAYSPIDPQQAVPLLFGLLAHARQGLSVDELVSIFIQAFASNGATLSRQDAADSIYLYLRQVRLFLAHRDGRYDFFFESFKIAAQDSYIGESAPHRPLNDWHKLLTKYFMPQPVRLAKRLPNVRKLWEEPYQQIRAGLLAETGKSISDLLFIDAKIAAGLLDDLLNDYLEALSAAPQHETAQTLKHFQELLKLEQHRLRLYPRDCFQYLYNRVWQEHRISEDLLEQCLKMFLKGGGTLLRSCIRSKPAETFLVMTLSGHEKDINTCVYSPDGKQICTGSEDATLRIWAADIGKPLAVFKGHTSAISCCAFSPDGKLVVSGDKIGTVKLWDCHTLKELYTYTGLLSVQYCAFLQNGSRIVAHGLNTLKIWDALTGTELSSMQTGVLGFEFVVCTFSPDGNFMVLNKNKEKTSELTNSTKYDETFELWNIPKGTRQTILVNSEKDFSWGTCYAFSNDSHRLVTNTNTESILRLWDTRTGNELISLTGHSASWFAFSPDDNYIFFRAANTMKVWEVSTGVVLENPGEFGSKPVAFSPDGKRIVGCIDNTLRIWNADEMKEKRTSPIEVSYGAGIRSCSFSPDGKMILTSCEDNALRIWDCHRGSVISTYPAHEDGLRCSAFSPDGSLIVSGGSDGIVKLWDSLTGREIKNLVGHQSVITSCAFSPDGSRILTSSGDNSIKIWDPATGKVALSLPGHSDSVESCAFSPDGKLIVSGGYDSTVKLWDSHFGKELLCLKGHKASVKTCGFSPDGKLIISGGYDNTIKLWDVQTGTEIITLSAHKNSVESCIFSPNGHLIISGSYDNTIRLWNGETFEELVPYSFDQEIVCVSFSPDSALIACGERRGNLHIFILDGFMK